MWSRKSVRKPVAIALAISSAANAIPLCLTMPLTSGETTMRRACLRSSIALTSRFFCMRSARQAQQAETQLEKLNRKYLSDQSVQTSGIFPLVGPLFDPGQSAK